MSSGMKKLADISGADKVAMFMLSIPEESATEIFAGMSDEEIKEISFAMSNLGSVESNSVDELLDQFNKEIRSNTIFLGNLHNTEKLLSKVLDPERARQLIEDIRGPQGKNTWEKLGSVSEELLAMYLHNEHPQTAALVLSKVASNHAAKVLSLMDEIFAYDVIVRLMNMGPVKKEVLERVEKILRAEFISTIGRSAHKDSYALIAEIFHNFDRASEAKYMEMLETKMPDEADHIKALMFTFEDLIKVDAKGIQVILRSVDKQKLTLALKGCSESVRETFFSNMSERAARIIMEEIESLGQVRVKDADEAQVTIIKEVKKLIDNGEVVVADDNNDEYI